MIPPPQPDSITFTFLLGGKSGGGQEQRPDRCEDCSEMPNCVLDCFYDALSKGVGCASQSSAPTEQEIRDKVLKILEKLVAAFYEYDLDVICEEVTKPPKHIRMIDEAEAMIADLRTPATEQP